MPETITSGYKTEKNAMRNIAPWVWLFKCNIDGTNGAFLAGYDQSITYSGNTYQPFPIMIETLERDISGTVPQVNVIVSNVSREIATYCELGGIVDRDVSIYLHNTNQAGVVVDFGSFTVQGVALNTQVATITVGPYNLFDAQFPSRLQLRGRCDKVYGSRECLYDTTLPNAVSGTYPSFDTGSCDYSPEGSNGCRVHGDNEVANGRPRLHPDRFGGAIGIPKGPARV